MSQKTKSILMRFFKSGLAGAVSAMVLVSYAQPSVWSDFITVFNLLGIAGLSGFVTGILMALEKWANWKE